MNPSLNENVVHNKQRVLILAGGGALGAYQAGAVKALCNILMEQDKKNGEQNRLLFDVIAGTSIGAMNGAVFIRQYLQTSSWNDAANTLIDFWTDPDYGLGSNIDDKITPQLEPWLRDEEWYKEVPGAASKEAARRYYSACYYPVNGARNLYDRLPNRQDFKFFDNTPTDLIKWFIHSDKPLQDSIEHFANIANFPVATEFSKNQPRFLVFSVDVLEGQTVTFDSYEKADDTRKSEYGCYDSENKKYEYVIKYRGVTLEHVMASGTLPEFYDYAKVPMHVQKKNCNSEKVDSPSNKAENMNIRYFWDGGLLSNTPFREVLQAHEDYWVNVQKCDKIPDLEIYLINLHPSKIDDPIPPMDHDGVKSRQNDITFCDRSSHYDENMAHMISNYKDLGSRLKDLADRAIYNSNDPQLREEFESILAMPTKDSESYSCRYEDLLKGRYNLKVYRIERKNDADEVFGKTADLSLKTIRQLIEKGERDATGIFS
ncbi:MAG TPA: patatin-like phospholipase family protein [Nitrososphaeraceae archaeon]|jgi:predicted acylesterase/phospholipase RssA